jgi:hypothetical protein
VDGRLNEKQADLKEILVDADGTGKAVQESYFQAPISALPAAGPLRHGPCLD